MSSYFKVWINRMIVWLILNIFEALLVKMIWGWFIAPVFSLPAIPFLSCYALLLVVALFQPTSGYKANQDDEDDGWVSSLYTRIIVLTIVFVLAWLLHFL